MDTAITWFLVIGPILIGAALTAWGYPAGKVMALWVGYAGVMFLGAAGTLQLQKSFVGGRHMSHDASADITTEELLRRQAVLMPLLREVKIVKRIDWKSPEAITYYNKMLDAQGFQWRVTPENIDHLFGAVIYNTVLRNGHTGVKLDGSDGNTFDGVHFENTETAVDLKNSNKNRFKDLNIRNDKK